MNEKLGYPAAMRWNLEADATHHRALSVFNAVAAANGMSVLMAYDLPGTREKLRPDLIPGRPLLWVEYFRWQHLVARWRDTDAIVLIRQHERSGGVMVAADDLGLARKIIAEVLALFPPAPISEKAVLPITFWHHTDKGPQITVRDVELASWTVLAPNYSAETRARLEPLMERFRPAKNNGRILLWYGEPGTGKTYAIRALAWAWREWCRFEYVIDPEQMLEHASYLTEVLLRRMNDGAEIAEIMEKMENAETEQEAAERRRKWRLLILEDSGEMIGMDAKNRIGQGLSRLLNISDGILGQGTKIMILITTNEELGRLNPAIMRPGRCLSQVDFRRFSAEESNQWLRQAGCEKQVDGLRTLSQLYALASGQPPALDASPLGFLRHQNGAAERTR